MFTDLRGALVWFPGFFLLQLSLSDHWSPESFLCSIFFNSPCLFHTSPWLGFYFFKHSCFQNAELCLTGSVDSSAFGNFYQTPGVFTSFVYRQFPSVCPSLFVWLISSLSSPSFCPFFPSFSSLPLSPNQPRVCYWSGTDAPHPVAVRSSLSSLSWLQPFKNK